MPIKRIMRDAVLYGLSIAIMKGISLLMLPFVTRYLSPSEFGRLELIGTFTMIASIVAGLGLAESLYRYAGQAKTDTEASEHASRIFGLTLIMGMVVLAFTFVSAPLFQSILPGEPSLLDVHLVMSMLALEGIIAVPLGWLRMQNKAVLFFSFTLGRTTLQAILIIVALEHCYGVTGVLATGLIAALTTAILLTLWQIKNSGVMFSHPQNKATLRYSLPIVGTGIMTFGLFGLDRWILDLFVSHDDVGLYAVSAKFALTAVLLFQPFTMWWQPNRFRLLSNHRERYTQIVNFGIVVLITIMVGVNLGAPVLINWIMPESYQGAIFMLAGLVLAMALKELAELVNIGCLTGDRTEKQFYINIMSTTIGVAGMLMLGQHFGIHGVIAGLNLGYASKALTLYLASQQVEHIHFYYKKLFVLVMVAALLVTQTPTLSGDLLGLIKAGLITLLIPTIAAALDWKQIQHWLSRKSLIEAKS